MTPTEVLELLVRQCLDGCGVERPLAVGDRARNRVLGNHGLAATGGGGNEDRLGPVEGVQCPQLERVELERVGGHQSRAIGPGYVRVHTGVRQRGPSWPWTAR